MNARSRWMAYGVCLLLSAVAKLWIDHRREEAGKERAAAVARAPDLTGPAYAVSPVQPARLSETAADVKADRSAPLSARGRVSTALSPARIDPPQAPPLPFSYVGRWTQDRRTVVVLSRGGQHVAVPGPGRLDEIYAVESVDDKRLVMTYLPLGIRQVLPLDPPRSPAASVTLPHEAVAPEDSSEELN